jgi:SAM-dependent methyltransferase
MKRRLTVMTNNPLIGRIANFMKIQKQIMKDTPAVGEVIFGDLRKIKPISTNYGFDRGLPIDRYYIENFLARYSADIQGHVLEIGDNSYTVKFGGNRLTTSDVLHVKESNQEATVIGDLCDVPQISTDTFDCIILTQTLQYIYDMRSAIRSTCRILKPGGIVLVTIPGITQLADADWNDSWYWGFTKVSAKKLFEEVFPEECVKVEAFGNILAAISFLEGLAADELEKEELDFYDPSYPVSIAIRAVKPKP